MRKILTIVVIVSQSLPNQVNDFNTALGPWSAGVIKIVAIPSKPGQRLQSSEEGVVTVVLVGCRNPFQTRSTTSMFNGIRTSVRIPNVSQSLPNQVNDFNLVGGAPLPHSKKKSQSLPNQVNDFN